jgi:hypothetical protein
LTPADSAQYLSVKVTGTLAGYTTATAASGTVLVAAGTLTPATPEVTGAYQVGETLTASRGTWGPAGVQLAYQWLRNGNTISGATGSTYTLTAADNANSVSVKVTGSLAGYQTESRTSAAQTVALGVLTPGTPSVSGAYQVGNTLTASTGTWQPADVQLAYQWLRDGNPIAGANARAYTLAAADYDSYVSVRVIGALGG